MSQEINAELVALQASDLSARSRLEIQARVARIAGTCLADTERALARLELHTEHGAETYADLIEALCSGGPELVDLLLRELRRVRGLCEERMTVHSRWALQSFGFLEQSKVMSQRPDVVAALTEGLTSRHALVRLEAVDSLGGLSLESMPSVVAAIKTALGDPDWRVRYVAEQILGDAGMLPPEHRVSLFDRIRRVVRPEPSWASARWSIGWVLLAYLLMGCYGPAESSDVAAEASLAPQFRSAMGLIGERAVTHDGVVGLAIAVAMDQEVVFAEGFGSADAAGELPIDAETRFDLGSIGKVFTSAAVMQLVEQGKLSLDDRVQDHLSWIPPHYPEATLEQLLRHTSGFVSQEVDEFDPPADYFEPRFGAALLTDSELVNGVARFPAGENHVYSNPGFLFLGEVIEAASGVRYDRYVAQRVIDSAGPNQMLVCQAPPGEKATAHFRREDERLRQAPPLHMSAWGGSGGVRSGVSNLIRWMIRLDAGEIVNEETLARMRTPTTLRSAQGTAEVPYGLGMRLGAFRGAVRYGHTGTYPSGTAALYSYPEASLQIAVLSNTNGPEVPHAHRYEAEIAALLLDLEPQALTPVALTSEEKWMMAGTYEDFRAFTVSFAGDELVVRYGDEELERIVHVGDLAFRRRDQPDMLQRFHLEGIAPVGGNTASRVMRSRCCGVSPTWKRTREAMSNHRVYSMIFAKVYPMYVQKAEKKQRTKEEVDEVIRWLTGYSQAGLEKQLAREVTVQAFIDEAPAFNPNASLIKGVVCGVRVEEVEEPLMRKLRYLDKLVDELARGKAMEKILRS